MLALRYLLFYTLLVIVAIITSILCIMSYFASYDVRYYCAKTLPYSYIWLMKVIFKIKIDIQGIENVYKKPCVIVSNHESVWECMAFATIFPKQTFVVKKELKWVPFFGLIIKVLNAIHIDRKDKLKSMKKVIKDGSSTIADGISLIIFPEGTRTPYKTIGKYQAGAIAIAKKANVPIQPVYHNSGKICIQAKIAKGPENINVIVGKPIYVNDKKPEVLIKEIEDWTKEQLHRVENQ